MLVVVTKVENRDVGGENGVQHVGGEDGNGDDVGGDGVMEI